MADQTLDRVSFKVHMLRGTGGSDRRATGSTSRTISWNWRKADFLLRQDAAGIALRSQAGPNRTHEIVVLALDLRIDPIVQELRCPRLTPSVTRQAIGAATQAAFSRSRRDRLEEVDHVGIEIEPKVGQQRVKGPGAPAVRRQVRGPPAAASGSATRSKFCEGLSHAQCVARETWPSRAPAS